MLAVFQVFIIPRWSISKLCNIKFSFDPSNMIGRVIFKKMNIFRTYNHLFVSKASENTNITLFLSAPCLLLTSPMSLQFPSIFHVKAVAFFHLPLNTDGMLFYINNDITFIHKHLSHNIYFALR